MVSMHPMQTVAVDKNLLGIAHTHHNALGKRSEIKTDKYDPQPVAAGFIKPLSVAMCSDALETITRGFVTVCVKLLLFLKAAGEGIGVEAALRLQPMA